MERQLILLTILVLFYVNFGFAQKKELDSNTFISWPSLSSQRPLISNDGRYVIYNINNDLDVLGVLKSMDGKWEKKIIGGVNNACITADSKSIAFIKGKDSLAIISLGTKSVKYIPNVSYFKLGEYDKATWLLYTPNSSTSSLVLRNLQTEKERIYRDVISWEFSKDCKTLILITKSQHSSKLRIMNWVDIVTDKAFKIWEGDCDVQFSLDEKHQQLAFRANESILYYKLGSAMAISIIDKKCLPQNGSVWKVDNFTKDGSGLFVSIKQIKENEPKKQFVEVWSYRNLKLDSENNEELSAKKYLIAIGHNCKIFQLQTEYERLLKFPSNRAASDTIVLVRRQESIENWNFAGKITWSLVSVKSGSRKNLSFLDNQNNVEISPFGKFLIYYSSNLQNYFSYEITTGLIRNLTNDLGVSWLRINANDRFVGAARGLGKLVWLKNDESVLICDQYDIWNLDPLNRREPINLTNGYGKRNNIVFNLIDLEDLRYEGVRNRRLILNAFNLDNKYNGFYSTCLNTSTEPRLLTMGPYLYDIPDSWGYLPDEVNFSPIKSRQSLKYLVRRMSATEAPNYFSTKDFKTFTRLSNLQPQKKYNWYTTELHIWKSLDGRDLQGILYKPENFDPNKKYPIIFHYYERKSDGLNAFIKPEALSGCCNINIPTYVSNGYLVFSPDIYYKIGDPMKGTYDAIVSAAKYVSSLSYVNGKKMGIQGCSFGGIQTNYIVTHTNLFSAAVSSASVADWVSLYGGIINGYTRHNTFELGGQFRVGASLWEKPEVYIKNSAVFQVNRVTTPILLMTDKNDGGCPFENIVEFYTGLRRLGKKAWMLIYPNGNHGVEGREADDFSMRMMQFFDYYLKDKFPPMWMTDGRNFKDRKTENRFKLDTTGRVPGLGILTSEEQKKVDSLMTRKPITITLQ